MRLTDFWERMEAHFGLAYAHSWAHDFVLPALGCTVNEAIARFGVTRALCVHRVGELQLGDVAVWVGVSSPHRDEAFKACRFIIDEVKHRVPIWKKEHYANGDSGWVNCERCAADAHAQDHAGHDHADHAHAGHKHAGA